MVNNWLSLTLLICLIGASLSKEQIPNYDDVPDYDTGARHLCFYITDCLGGYCPSQPGSFTCGGSGCASFNTSHVHETQFDENFITVNSNGQVAHIIAGRIDPESKELCLKRHYPDPQLNEYCFRPFERVYWSYLMLDSSDSYRTFNLNLARTRGSCSSLVFETESERAKYGM